MRSRRKGCWRGAVLVVASFVVLTGCSGKSTFSSPASSTTPGSGAETTAGSLPTETTEAPTITADPTTTTSTSSTSSTPTTPTTTTTTTIEGTTTSTIAGDRPSETTLPHGAGVTTKQIDGTDVPTAVVAAANEVYAAALLHYFGALRPLVARDGKSRFRTGYTTGNAVDRWKRIIDDGNSDPLARMVALLESTPGVTNDGQVVYPYLALKDPATWDANDDAAAAALGFTPESIAATKAKGRYLDVRLVFGADGEWRAFDIGGL